MVISSIFTVGSIQSEWKQGQLAAMIKIAAVHLSFPIFSIVTKALTLYRFEPQMSGHNVF